jgi:hypothetical protein
MAETPRYARFADRKTHRRLWTPISSRMGSPRSFAGKAAPLNTPLGPGES